MPRAARNPRKRTTPGTLSRFDIKHNLPATSYRTSPVFGTEANSRLPRFVDPRMCVNVCFFSISFTNALRAVIFCIVVKTMRREVRREYQPRLSPRLAAKSILSRRAVTLLGEVKFIIKVSFLLEQNVEADTRVSGVFVSRGAASLMLRIR